MRTGWLRANWQPVGIGVLAVGIAINFVLLVPALGRLSRQASDGNRARLTQCARDPVSQKLALAAYAVRDRLPAESRITPAELERFKKTRPKGCPKTPKK